MIPIFASRPFSESDWDTDKFRPRGSVRQQPRSPSALEQPLSCPCPTAAPSLISACVPSASSQLQSLLSCPVVYPPSGYTPRDLSERVFKEKMGKEEGPNGSWDGSVTGGKRVWELPKQRQVRSFMNTVQFVHFNPVNRAANLAEESHLKTWKSAQ